VYRKHPVCVFGKRLFFELKNISAHDLRKQDVCGTLNINLNFKIAQKKKSRLLFGRDSANGI